MRAPSSATIVTATSLIMVHQHLYIISMMMPLITIANDPYASAENILGRLLFRVPENCYKVGTAYQLLNLTDISLLIYYC